MGDYRVNVLGSDVEIYAWGAIMHSANWPGLGDNSGDNFSPTPVKVKSTNRVGSEFTVVSVGQFQSLALDDEGKLYSWGAYYDHALGTGTTVATNPLNTNNIAGETIPVHVNTGTTTFKQVAAGIYYSLALDTDGDIWSWGRNNAGQLGSGTSGNAVPAPQKMTKPAGMGAIKSIHAGFQNSFAITEDGDVWAWGYNSLGQLGLGDTTNRLSPVKIQSLSNVVDLDLGNFYVNNELATAVSALTSGGSVYSWGVGMKGQLGHGAMPLSVSSPVQASLPSGSSAKAIAQSGWHGVSLMDDGEVYAWGYNGAGELGNGQAGRVTNPSNWNSENKSTPVLATPVNDPAIPSQYRLPLVLTSVLFDGIEADPADYEMVAGDDGTWTVLTPAHEAGTVDVQVNWTIGGAQQAHTLSQEYTYKAEQAALEFTLDLTQQLTVTEEDAVELVVQVTCEPFPTLTWQRYNPVSNAWEDIDVNDPKYTISSDGTTLSFVADMEDDGARFRILANNQVSPEATSAEVLLKVLPLASASETPTPTPSATAVPTVEPTSDPTPKPTADPTTGSTQEPTPDPTTEGKSTPAARSDLAYTGMGMSPLVIVGAIALFVVGVITLVGVMRINRE